MSTYSWYKNLKKPFFAPPPKVFGIVWTILYPIIFISFGYTFYYVFDHFLPFTILTPFILNLIFNFLFTPIQFKLKNNYLAAVDITLVVVTLFWAMITIGPFSQIVAYVQIPYLLWGLFATILQYSITWLNRNTVKKKI